MKGQTYRYEFGILDEERDCECYRIVNNRNTGKLEYRQCRLRAVTLLNDHGLCALHAGMYIHHGSITILPPDGSEGFRELIHTGRYPQTGDPAS